MEQLLKSADTFLRILETAHSSRVASWEPSNITRALSWADHHQKLYNSYTSKTRIRSALDVELRKLAYRNCILINVFNFDFLKECRDFLIGMLRTNSALKPELAAFLPDPSTVVENTQIFKCLLNINKKLNRDEAYTNDVINTVCSTINEASSFQQSCPVLTTAPQRAITTLLTRVFQLSNDLIFQCFLHGNEVVKQSVTSWVETHGSGIWTSTDVKVLTRCSENHAGFCQLHVKYIVELFNLSYDYKQQHLSTSLRKCTGTVGPNNQLIFESTEPLPERTNYLTSLAEHLVLLHATPCYFIVQQLLDTLKCHKQFGSLANTFLTYLDPAANT